MKRITFAAVAVMVVTGTAAGVLHAQQPAQVPQPFFVGNRLGLPIKPAPTARSSRCPRT